MKTKQGSLRLFVITLLFFLLIFTPRIEAQIVLSEVMFNPSTSEAHDEFIEIFNISSDQNVDLNGWQIGDSLELDYLQDTGTGMILSARRYAVILDGSYFGNSTTYDNVIPDSVLIVKINDSTFGKSGWSNSNREPVRLVNKEGEEIASFHYPITTPAGLSVEKIDLMKSDNSSNWMSCKYEGGTPGCRNSVMPFPKDLEIRDLSIFPYHIRGGQPVTMNVEIYNQGEETARDYSLIIYWDADNDSISSDDEMLWQFKDIQTQISPQNSCEISYEWKSVPSGVHHIIALIEFPDDAVLENNIYHATLQVGYFAGEMLINEIMYRPGAGEPEWIELFNHSDSAVDVHNWKLSDSREDQLVLLIDTSLKINPGEYVTLAEDSLIWPLYPDLTGPVIVPKHGLPALNNSGDAVIIRDAAGFAVDSLFYSPEWGGESSVSMERIRPDRSSNAEDNWSTCTDRMGGTPNFRNSVSPDDWDIGIDTGGLFYEPASPLPGDEITVYAIVANMGQQDAKNILLSFYWDSNGDSLISEYERISSEIVVEMLSVEESKCLEMNWFVPESGFLSVWVSAQFTFDENIENNYSHMDVSAGFSRQELIINEIMYWPLSGYPEWVELYNRSENDICLKGWHFSDQSVVSKSVITDECIVIGSLDYIVLSQDSTICDLFGSLECEVLVPPQWHTLSSTNDAVAVFDQNGNVIDSVAYEEKWGGASGISLERINPNLPSNTTVNWNSCASNLGGTPGGRNSLYAEVIPPASTMMIAPNPFSPDGDGRDDVAMINYNLQVTTADITLKIYDVVGRLIRCLANNQMSGSEGAIPWDGRDDYNQKARIGVYIVYLEAINELAGFLLQDKSTVVVAGQL